MSTHPAPLVLALLAAGAAAQCELDELTASDASAGDEFGRAVSLDGDRALLGAPRDDDPAPYSGSAYVFERQGTLWVQTAELTADDGAEGDGFGVFVSLSGDRALVGAPYDDDAGFGSGSAYLFEKQGAVWVQTAKLAASDAAAGDDLGWSVCLSNDTAVVGAPSDDDAGERSGSAYVFEKQGAVWVQTAKLTAQDAAEGDRFGISVSVSNGRALVGASHDDAGGIASGSAYVFEKQGPAWIQTAKLTSSDAFRLDEFGWSVSLAGDRALVGAPNDEAAAAYSGSAYVFDKQGSRWVETAKLTAADAAEGDQLGISVSLSGDTALLGAWGNDEMGFESGSAYAFEQQGSLWVQTAKLTASDAFDGDYFGGSVSLSGGRALLGAFGDEDGGPTSGSAYVFSLSGPCLSGPTPGIVAVRNTITLSQATSGGLVGAGFGLTTGTTPVGAACPGLTVELGGPIVLGVTTADPRGSASFSGFAPPTLSGITLFLQGVDVSACEVTNLVAHTFP